MTVSLIKADYVSSKFDSRLAEELYDWTMDSSEDASLGESESFGWFALFRDERAILAVNSQGFVGVRQYETVTGVLAAWDGLEADYANFTLRCIIEALDTSCDDLFLIIDTAQHSGVAMPDRYDLEDHIWHCAQCKSLGNQHMLDA
jgi:hypothetical protein